jgi:hypothetical protein
MGDDETAQKEKADGDRDAYEDLRIVPYVEMIDRHGARIVHMQGALQKIHDPIPEDPSALDEVAQKYDKDDGRRAGNQDK